MTHKASAIAARLLALSLLAPGLALAADRNKLPAPSAPSPSQEQRYQHCLGLVKSDVAAAFDEANGWIDEGGGVLARHCLALAFVKMGKPHQAAALLDSLADELGQSEPDLAPDALAQGALAWEKDGNIEKAIADQTKAIKLRPRDPDLLIDRARMLASSKKFFEAVDDLNAALTINPKNIDALVYRASAYRQLETPELAADDLERALKLAPQDPDALLERGNLRRAKGDPKGARADWMKLLTTAPDAPAAENARANLEELDVKKD
jgi:tetratricopeptide (TPR) repeat protein